MALTSEGKQYLENRRNSFVPNKRRYTSVKRNSNGSTNSQAYRGYPNGDLKVSAVKADQSIMNIIKEW